MADQRTLQLILKLQNETSQELKKISGDLGGIEKDAVKAGGGFASFAKQIAGVAAAYLSFRKIYEGLALGIRVAADLQTAEIGLTTLLGSAEKAHKTVQRLKEEAKRTPFELPGLTQATQLLTAVTKDGDKSIDILLDVGEALAAMGKGQSELDRIIVNLQQVASLGHAATIDIKQFAFAGIPIYEMLSEATGKYGDDLQQLITDGGVTFDLLVEMFDKANDAGGRFFGAFENQKGTFNQALSNMKDSIGVFFADVVTKTGLLQGLTDAMIVVSDWMGNWEANIGSLRDRMKEIMQTIDEKTGLLTLLSEAWQAIVFMWQEQLKPALDELWIALEPLKPYLEALARVFGWILVGAIGLAIVVIGGLALALIQLLTWVTKVATFFQDVFNKALESVQNKITALVDWVGKLIDKLKAAWEWMQKVANNVGGAIGNAVGGILPGRAAGGPVSAGMPYMVGERGPELFVPRTSGTIMPNGSTGGMSVNVMVYGDVSGAELVQKVKDNIMMALRSNMKLPA